MRWWIFVLIVVMIVLHQDFWFWNEYKPLVFGFLPVGLAYHAGYSILCAVVMWLLVKFAWPVELEQVEASNPESSGTEKPQ